MEFTVSDLNVNVSVLEFMFQIAAQRRGKWRRLYLDLADSYQIRSIGGALLQHNTVVETLHLQFLGIAPEVGGGDLERLKEVSDHMEESLNCSKSVASAG